MGCPVCGSKLSDASLDPFWLQLSCIKHFYDGTAACSCCLRLAHRGAPHARVNAISQLCVECQPSTIRTDAQAAALYEEVGSYFRRVGAWGRNDALPMLKLVDQVQMHGLQSRGISVHKSVSAARHNVAIILGLCVCSHERKEVVRREGEEECYGLRRMGARVNYIALQKDLPLIQAGGTLAHELGHAHFATAGYPDLSIKLEEGLCEVWKVMWIESMLGKGAEVRSILRRAQMNPSDNHARFPEEV
jgi:hypothetical protein